MYLTESKRRRADRVDRARKWEKRTVAEIVAEMVHSERAAEVLHQWINTNRMEFHRPPPIQLPEFRFWMAVSPYGERFDKWILESRDEDDAISKAYIHAPRRRRREWTLMDRKYPRHTDGYWWSQDAPPLHMTGNVQYHGTYYAY